MRVLLCDDEQLVRKGIRGILEGQPDIAVVDEAENGDEAVRKIKSMGATVLLTEIRLPDENGFDLARRIALGASDTKPRVAFLTHHLTKEDVRRGLRVGVRGFMLKSDSPEKVLAGIRSLSTGHGTFSAAVFEIVMSELLNTIARGRVILPADLDKLTNREVDVLRLIAAGMNNFEIADSLTVSQATVKSHVSRLLSKLDLRDRAQAIVAAYRIGLVSAEVATEGNIVSSR